MPTYDFKCEKCGTVEEYFVPSTTSTPEKCICGQKTELKKENSFSNSRPILKGKGFYETDYKK